MAVFRVIIFALTLLSYAWVQAKYTHNNGVIMESNEDIVDANVGIIGGLMVKDIKEAPYMAALVRPQYVDAAGVFHKPQAFGAGCIIHEQFILTSASVVEQVNDTFKVLVGTERLSFGGQLIEVYDRLCHENYCDEFDNDICLLKLRTPAKLGPNVAKISLPDQDLEFQTGMLLNVTGWGMMEENVNPDQLRRTKVKLQTSDVCSNPLLNLTMTDNMICAGLKGQGPNVGDGGAPLTLYNMQVGLSSFIGEHTSDISVFTKVSKFAFWIDETISNNLN